MNTLESFDKIVKLEERRVTYREYFSVMEISQKQKKRREELADDFEDVFLLFFALYLASLKYGIPVDKAEAESTLKEQLEKAMTDHGVWSDTV